MSEHAHDHDHDERQNGPDAEWRDRLRARGHRLTPQRELVLAAVQRLGHATPEQVFEEVRRHSSAINLSTVYRTLELLDELELIQHAHIEERTPTYHAVGGHQHFHVVCHRCRKVTSVGPEMVAGLRDGLLSELSFSLDIGHLSVFGTCRECAAEIAAADAPTES